MNMPAYNLNNLSRETFTQTQSVSVTKARWQSAYSVLPNEAAITAMLDERFPLDQGSHADVKQYVIYFRHIMAFFQDGSHCGLAQPKQFVALCGHRDEPDSIVLKEGHLHVELKFDRNGTRGKHHPANIDDIQIEFVTQREFTAPDGSDYTI